MTRRSTSILVSALLIAGAGYLWLRGVPWRTPGWSVGSAVAAAVAATSVMANVVQIGGPLRSWWARTKQTLHDSRPARLNVSLVALAGAGFVATVLLQRPATVPSPAAAPQPTRSTVVDARGTPSPAASTASPAVAASRSASPLLLPPPSPRTAPSSGTVPVPPAPPTAAPSTSGPIRRELPGTGSHYVNFDDPAVPVADDPGTESRFDLHVSYTQATPMDNMTMGVVDGTGHCGPQRKDATPYPIPGTYCGQTYAGRAVTFTLAHGDGTVVLLAVTFPPA